jgi:membrane-bound metal-dependent hydrolase YbcI (DUF457 family)
VPITPLHLGPGALAKFAGASHFSLLAFSAGQFAIDLEPLYYLLAHDPPVHRYFHSVLGALAVSAVVAGVLGLARRWLSTREAPLLRALRADLSNQALVVGAVVGGLSHVLLDWSMHGDVRPFYPSHAVQGWGGFVPSRAMLLSCLLAGVGGVIIFVARRGRNAL